MRRSTMACGVASGMRAGVCATRPLPTAPIAPRLGDHQRTGGICPTVRSFRSLRIDVSKRLPPPERTFVMVCTDDIRMLREGRLGTGCEAEGGLPPVGVVGLVGVVGVVPASAQTRM